MGMDTTELELLVVWRPLVNQYKVTKFLYVIHILKVEDYLDVTDTYEQLSQLLC